MRKSHARLLYKRDSEAMGRLAGIFNIGTITQDVLFTTTGMVIIHR
jgi:hypothetical protein